MDYNILIERIHNSDPDQVEYLNEVGNNLRFISPELLRKYGCFYVPYEDYLVDIFGTHLRETQWDLYLDQNPEFCKYYQRLVIPIYNFVDEAVALCGWDQGNDYDTEQTFHKYIYSNKRVWDKSNFMFITRDEYIKAIEDGYLMIVDGMFDKMKLTDLGYNAASLMGSKISPTIEYMLSQIKHIIVIPDNDSAGSWLENAICRNYPGSSAIHQNKCKDIDAFLREESNQIKFRNTFERMKKQHFILKQTIK